MGKGPGIIESMEQRQRDGDLNPLTATLELTHGCNLRCRHCYLEHRGGRAELTTAEWTSVIDQAIDMGAYFGGFTGGEILFRRDFFEIAGHALGRGMFFHLQTNGTFIDKAVADAVQQLQPTKVEMSLYGASAGVHEEVTRVSGSFRKTIRAAELLRERDIKVCFKTTVMAGNREDIPAIRKLAAEMGAWFVADPVVMPGVFGSGKPVEFRMSDSDYRGYMVSEGWGRIPGKELEALVSEGNKPQHRVLCTAAKKRFAVSPHGDVIPCVIWRIVCGNTREAPLDAIWQGEKMGDLRAIQYEDLRGCPDCVKYESCVRCAGLAYLETGDSLGCPDESRRLSDLLQGIKDENRSKSG